MFKTISYSVLQHFTNIKLQENIENEIKLSNNKIITSKNYLMFKSTSYLSDIFKLSYLKLFSYGI